MIERSKMFLSGYISTGISMDEDTRYMWIKKNYHVPGEFEDDIRSFISNNPEVMDILEQAPYYIRHIVGDYPLYLEIVREPDDGWEELFIVVRTGLPAEEALKLDDRLFELWFGEAMRSVVGKLEIVVE